MMSFWTDPTDIPHCSVERHREIAQILARGLVRWHSRRNREALSDQIPQESSESGLALSSSSRPYQSVGLTHGEQLS